MALNGSECTHDARVRGPGQGALCVECPCVADDHLMMAGGIPHRGTAHM